MGRKEELLELINNDIVLVNLVDEVIFLEEKLEELKKYPFIRVNSKNPTQQKSTVAQKQYKDLLQQYTNAVKILSRVTNDDNNGEESPLRKWVREHVEQKDMVT